MKLLATLLAASASLTLTAAAFADGTAPAPTYTTRVVDIVGRRAQPVAAVEVTRAVPSVRLRELRPAFAVGADAVSQP